MAKKFADFYQVYVLDLRNHGASPHHPEMDYPLMVEDLIAFMDEQGLQKTHILGHSMGGESSYVVCFNLPRTNK